MLCSIIIAIVRTGPPRLLLGTHWPALIVALVVTVEITCSRQFWSVQQR